MSDNELGAEAGGRNGLLARTRECGAGLVNLRQEHLTILERVREEEENLPNTGAVEQVVEERAIEDRIGAVTEQLQLLEVVCLIHKHIIIIVIVRIYNFISF